MDRLSSWHKQLHCIHEASNGECHSESGASRVVGSSRHDKRWRHTHGKSNSSWSHVTMDQANKVIITVGRS
jgi:hypothetical protein